MKLKRLYIIPLVFCLLLTATLGACKKTNQCKVSIGNASFSIDPNSALYSRLNTVGGYEYFSGGHHGVVVVRTGYNEFVAFERTCPLDDSSRVVVSETWGSTILECPTCHSLFSTHNYGTPMDGSATPCSLYPYSTTYDGSTLYVY